MEVFANVPCSELCKCNLSLFLNAVCVMTFHPYIANLSLECWEEKEVTECWICRLQGVWDNSHATTGQKCLNFQVG
jgi:hypothetical protein